MRNPGTCQHNISLTTWCNFCALANQVAAEREAKDAARYRWLRDGSHKHADGVVMLDLDGEYFTEDKDDQLADAIDLAVDAGIEATSDAASEPSKEEK